MEMSLDLKIKLVKKWKEKLLKMNENMKKNCQNINYYCSEHQKKLDIFCEFCKECLCSKCALFGDHNSHTFIELDKILQVIIEKNINLNIIIETIDNFQIIEHNSSIDTYINKLIDIQKNKLTEEINCSFDKLNNMIQNKKDELIKNMNESLNIENFSNYSKNIDKFWNDWNFKLKNELKNFINFDINNFNNYLSNQTNFDFIKEVNNGHLLIDDLNKLKLKNTFEAKNKIESVQISFNLDELNIDNIFKFDDKLLLEIENVELDKNYLKIINLNPFKDDKIMDLTSLIGKSNIEIEDKKANSNFNNLNIKKKKSIIYQVETPIQLNDFSKKLLKKKKIDIKILPNQKMINYVIECNKEIIDLSSSELGDNGIAALYNHFILNKNITNIKFMKNKITDSGFFLILNSLWNNKDINSLNLNFNLITEKCFTNLLIFIDSHPNLKNISLTNNNININNCRDIWKIIKSKNINILI